jgi:DNA repair exonuclease SbcCD ATPase subunit/DNA repair exonuclease SbcCD nuclease subunit
MRILISSDWQAEYSNHDQCVTAWEFVLKQCKKYSLEAIVLAGDLKHSYNPLDIRVIKFWFKAIRKAIERNIRVIILLGNHDREGLYTDKRNWLSILRKAGAETFDSPGVCELTNGKIGMLPFTTSNRELRKRAKLLSELEWDKNKDILLFHADIKDCKYNQLGTLSHSRLRISELYPEKYLAVIGGHIHLPQEHYVGSPFAMDYGEVNQKKRFLLVLDSEVKSIDSPLPGYYDPSWPGFIKPKAWKGARVRIHVDVDTDSNYKKILDRAQLLSEREYPGAIIKIVPNFIQEEKCEAKVNVNDSDEQKIKAYVNETIIDKLEKQKDKIISFLVSKLKESEGLRRHGSQQIEFIDFEGENFLSFKKIKCLFKKQGLVLIEGTNKDWSNQSNGSGKSNYIQSIPVSLYGRTFKGQKYDRWARRQTKNKARARLRLRSNGKVYTIVRGRHPNRLQLLVEGKDNSSGINKSSTEGTQSRIESVSGFSWHTLANSVYIDRTIASAFITGSRSDRISILYKFQNLERFERALVLVKKYKQRHETTIEQNQKAIDSLESELSEHKRLTKEYSKDNKEQIKTIHRAYKKHLHEWKQLHSKKKILERKSNHKYRKYQKKYDNAAKMVTSYETQIEIVNKSLWNVEQLLSRYKNLVDKNECPTCHGKISSKQFKQKIETSQRSFIKVKRKLKILYGKRTEYNNLCAKYEGEIDKAKLDFASARDKADLKQSYLRSMKKEIQSNIDRGKASKKEIFKRYKKRKQELIEFKEYKHQLEKDSRFITYCEEAFNKDGLPAFINAQVAPILNKACEHYSDMFCDKEVLVQFKPDEGDLVPKIINLHGGEKATDQSNGEASIAGLITSFALKEIAPKTNVLILDEPEAGLSPHNIRRFAKSLTEMKKRFESIFVVTHSPILLGELSNEKVIKIEKHHSISKVI